MEGEETDDEEAKVQCDLDEDRAEIIQEAENAMAKDEEQQEVEIVGGATLAQLKLPIPL